MTDTMIETQVPHERDHDIPDELERQRIGGWLPADHRTHNAWLKQQAEHVDKHPQELNPALKEFEQLVKGNPKLRMLSEAMFTEIPHKQAYRTDPVGHKQIRDFDHLLQTLNHIMSQGPHFTEHQAKMGLVGVPMNATLDWPMATPSGYAFFLDEDLNKGLKKVLNYWGKYLMTEDSAKVLSKHKTGWFGQTGINDICVVANEATGEGSNLTFEQCFKCDPSHPTYGYKSWDHFFTRELADGYRPTASPDDDSVIVNACESRTFNLQHNVKLVDEFWTKGNKYSLNDMFARKEIAKNFEGGTVYQAFLSALSYHRWHSPVAGTIVEAFVQDGTYFSEKISSAIINTNDAQLSKAGLTNSQSYIAHLATRAIIIIEADNKDIGLVGFVGIGMDEVSTCEIFPKKGDHVKKGECTGCFHFGGSSHTVTFQKGVNVTGFPKAGQSANVRVRDRLAVVHPKRQ